MNSDPQIQMLVIPFTQYILPDNRRAIRRFAVPDPGGELAVVARDVTDRGARFECRVLRTGEVSLTITGDIYGDLFIQVVPSSEVDIAIIKLLGDAAKEIRDGRWSLDGVD